MKLADTTGFYGKHHITNEESIERCVKAGFKYIDFSFYNEANTNSLFMQDNFKDYVNTLCETAKKNGATFVQAHLPGINPIEKGDKEKLNLDSTIRCIEACEIMGINNAVIHVGCDGNISKDEFLQRNKDFFTKLYPIMEKTGVNVLAENSTNANMPIYYYLYKGKDMVEFCESMNHPMIFACWDTGHANIEGHQYEEIMTIGKYLKALHFNDNRGKIDEHILPYMGTMNVDEVMNALIDVKYEGYLTFECDSAVVNSKYWLHDRRGFDKDTRTANPPIEMSQKLQEAEFLCGKYILSQYGLLEE